MTMPWIGATVSYDAQKWMPSGTEHVWWDGTTHAAVLLGWRNGLAISAVQLLGQRQGASILPIAPKTT
jgi:hypothetical protein